ncbi:MAG: peptide chain release factor 3 [Oligoflexia bacterium]|nr:peptide chain release factor 3 [Oligoflexia bacterium]
MNPQDKREIERRRTFAIISHPDAGKTTMTEKLLLYGGAIHEAGEVKAKKERRSARSDWMKLEQERGISVSTSVMQFDYKQLKINLLDTPGHADFSEDTYRTLAAVDSALMVLDNAKGVESQTKKLYEVCRLRKTPIFTFINKLDREGRSPFELMDEIEKVLNIQCNPITWPIGMGKSFRGIYHRELKSIILFKESGFATTEAEEVSFSDIKDSKIGEVIGDDAHQQLIEDIELLDGTLGPLDRNEFLAGNVTPVMFGSARTNFGVNAFLDLFCKNAPGPFPQKNGAGDLVAPTEDLFSGFVFKIQANMDKMHRDRIVFLRICSGKFERGMYVKNPRLEKEIRLSHSAQFMARDRSTVETAYAGDILGFHDNGNCRIGDTLYTGSKSICYEGIPQFSPEFFAKVDLADPLKRKQFNKGIRELCEEGTIQMFIDPRVGDQDPLLGAVGQLQFEVLLYRMKDEYGVDVKLRSQPFRHARWIRKKDASPVSSADVKGTLQFYEDTSGYLVGLFTSDFHLEWAKANNENILFMESFLGNPQGK